MKTPTPKVSVCVVTYNHANFISQCIESIAGQITNFPFEICLGEDESSDGTRDICLELAKKYPDKIRLFLRSRKDAIIINGKPTGRYNGLETLKACGGKYIAICDGDDFWTDPYKLQKQYDFMQTNPDYFVCHHPVTQLTETTGATKETTCQHLPTDNFTAELAKGNPIHSCSVFFRWYDFSTLPSWTNDISALDWSLWLLFSNFGKIKCLEENMASYRIHQSSTWSVLNFKAAIKHSSHNITKLDEAFNGLYTKQFKVGKLHLYYNSLFKLSRSGDTLTFFSFWIRSFVNLIYPVQYKLTDLFNHLKAFILNKVN
ncbi:MAG: glycosyltransferase [bacterium]|nr:glycosyltransferase [bacterium]